MTSCPKPDQQLAVSRTTSPVTQVAEVAVNSASEKEAPPRAFVEKGSISSAVPSRISSRKPRMITRAGDTRSLFQKGANTA